jgi:hypothetical protein
MTLENFVKYRPPHHPDAINQKKSQEVVEAIEAALAGLGRN